MEIHGFSEICKSSRQTEVQMLQDNYEGTLPIFVKLVKARMSKFFSNDNTYHKNLDDFSNY